MWCREAFSRTSIALPHEVLIVAALLMQLCQLRASWRLRWGWRASGRLRWGWGARLTLAKATPKPILGAFESIYAASGPFIGRKCMTATLLKSARTAMGASSARTSRSHSWRPPASTPRSSWSRIWRSPASTSRASWRPPAAASRTRAHRWAPCRHAVALRRQLACFLRATCQRIEGWDLRHGQQQHR